MLYRKVVNRENSKHSHHKKSIFLFIVSVRDDGCQLNLLWLSNHPVVCLKLTDVCQLFLNKTGGQKEFDVFSGIQET